MKFTLPSSHPVSNRQAKAHPHSVSTDPTGKYLVVPDLGADLIRIFRINASDGTLVTCSAIETQTGEGPRHSAWWVKNEGGKNITVLYIINELSSSLTVWQAKYSETGCLSFDRLQTISTAVAGKTPRDAKPSSAGEVQVFDNFLYASNRNDQAFGTHQDSLVTYTVNGTGMLSLLEATNAHAWYPRTFSINKRGDLVAVGGQASSTVAIISRDTSSGRLGHLLTSLQVGKLGTDGGWDGLSSVIWTD